MGTHITHVLVRESALVLLQTAPMHIEVKELQQRLLEKVISSFSDP